MEKYWSDEERELSFVIAAAHNNQERVRELLENGETDVDQHMNGWSALMSAAQSGHVAIVRLLLDNKASVNQARLDNGWTALMSAAHNGRLEVLDVLLTRGADVNQARTDNGETALMTAVRANRGACVAALLAHGAQVDQARSDTGLSALMIACEQGRADVARQLVEQQGKAKKKVVVVDQRQTAKGGHRTALMWAAHSGHVDIAQYLIEQNADVDGALVIAAEKGQIEVVKLLLRNKANVNEREEEIEGEGEGGAEREAERKREGKGRTALMEAVRRGRRDVAELLLAADADVALETHNGHTALHSAQLAIWNEEEMVEVLLAAGAVGSFEEQGQEDKEEENKEKNQEKNEKAALLSNSEWLKYASKERQLAFEKKKIDLKAKIFN